MPTSGQKLAALLRDYREPPPGLSDEWVRIYHALFDPANVVVNLGGSSGHASRGSRELYVAMLNTLRHSITLADAVLQFVRVNSPRTWRAGREIKTSISPITIALASAIQYLANPYPTRNGQEATENSLRAKIASALDGFNPIPLLDELVAAVVADYAAQRTTASQASAGEGLLGEETTNNQPTTRKIEKKTKGKNIKARMLNELSVNPDSAGWTASQWATKLKCADATVKETSVWKETLMAARAYRKADAATRMERTMPIRKKRK